MDYLPRFALTGYDHGMFFLRGIYNNGKKFNGSTADKMQYKHHCILPNLVLVDIRMPALCLFITIVIIRYHLSIFDRKDA